MLFPQGEAQFSGCGRYRYRLTRELGGKLTITFIMLNPSTADGTVDDPTIRRCKGFARDWGYGRLIIVNLYAFRATDPHDMWTMKRFVDIVGEDNDSAITRAVCDTRYGMWPEGGGPTSHRDNPEPGLVVAAWGTGSCINKDTEDFHRARQKHVAKLVGGDLYCLGITKRGDPLHPLYISGDTEAMLWKGPE